MKMMLSKAVLSRLAMSAKLENFVAILLFTPKIYSITTGRIASIFLSFDENTTAPSQITIRCRLIFVGKHSIAHVLTFKDKYSATSFSLNTFFLRKQRFSCCFKTCVACMKPIKINATE